MLTLEEFSEACDFLLTDPRAAPVLKIGEIHVCGDVLPAGIFVDGGTFQSLLEQIGADAATRAAMIELLRSRAVVDGEYAAGFPVRQPFAEIAAVGIVNFDPLSDRMAFPKCG